MLLHHSSVQQNVALFALEQDVVDASSVNLEVSRVFGLKPTIHAVVAGKLRHLTQHSSHCIVHPLPSANRHLLDLGADIFELSLAVMKVPLVV